MMEWNVTQASQRLPEVLRAATVEPQRIYSRRRLVATVVDGETFEEFWRWKQQCGRQKSIGEEFAELRAICDEEGGWELPASERSDRPNPFAEALEDAALRHEYSE